MVEPYVAFVLNRCGNIIDEDIKSLRGVKRGIAAARSEFTRTLAFLRDAGDLASRGNHEVRACIYLIQSEALDLEDILDSLDEKADRRRRDSKWRRRFRVPELLDLYRRDVALKLEHISKQLPKYYSMLETKGVRDLVNDGVVLYLNTQQIEQRRCVPHLSDYDIMYQSLSHSVEDLASEMTRSVPDCWRNFAICAMGGSGKTTMARLVYNNQRVRDHFAHFAWVQIGPQFRQEDVWNKILTDLRVKDYDTSGDLAETLCKVLTELKCLVVIDDVWAISTCDRLKQAFPRSGSGSGSGSTILITTRNKEVGSKFDPNSFLCEPQLLDPDESWSFFTTKSGFEQIRHGHNQADKDEMKRLGQEMVKFCFGLPLALEVLAGVLCGKKTVTDWENIHANVTKYVRTGHISENAEREQYSGVSWLLSLSYQELSHPLQQCFLHLAHFADNNISMNELYQIWMAEDMVSSEDEAAAYFNKLVDRYLVQVVERSSTGGVKRYTMHGLIRDLCLTKAGDENFLQIKDFANRHRKEAAKEPSVHSKARRLMVNIDEGTKDELVPLISNTSDCVRSLMCFSTIKDPYFEPALKPIFHRFRRLRALKFVSQTRGQIGKLPSEILKLVHLRFLSLKDINVTELPSSMSKLRRLQTLDLRTNWKLAISNKTISGLTNLRHLYFPQQIEVSGEELNLSKLKNLRTLVNIPTNCCNMNDLVGLLDLRKLKVKWDGRRIRVQSVTELNKLASLAVDNADVDNADVNNADVNSRQIQDDTLLIFGCPRIVKLCLGFKMETLSASLLLCWRLQKLTLRECCLQTDPMETLQRLPRLKVVRFEEKAFAGERMDCSSGGFAALECLYFIELPEFNELVLADGAFPSLRRMVINNCPNFTTARGEILRFTVRNLEFS